ncbi:MAG: sulfatase, partial [Akkermansiaceae bacterium]|nr:sulfatase [Akkermansiaceae bacterium]
MLPRLSALLPAWVLLASGWSLLPAQPPKLPELPPPPLPEKGDDPRIPLPTGARNDQPRPPHRPHIIMIVADDLAWDDLGAFGNDKVRTPNLDRLAAEGIAFDQAFLTISSCSPSRASILTGRYPHQTDAEELHWPLPESQITFVQRLKGAGYWTAAAGKWHLGDEVRDHFDLIREVDTSGFQLPAHAGANPDARFVETSSGDAKSGCADWVALLRERPEDRPAFLWLAAVDPHRPYDDGIIDPPHAPADVILPPYHPDTPLVRRDYARYYDEIARLDRFVGEVLDELQDQDAVENTIVIFLSDNGRPFPRDKTTLYDSGIRTPLIVRWPAVVKAGIRCKQLVSSVDLATTMLHITKINPGPRFVGKNFTPLLMGQAREIRGAVFAEKNWHDYEDRSRAVRDKRFKYIVNHYHDLPATP